MLRREQNVWNHYPRRRNKNAKTDDQPQGALVRVCEHGPEPQGTPKGPQITRFCHQMGRHPTICDFKPGIRHRIPARISPWGSRGPNPNFFVAYFGPKLPKTRFSGRVSNLSATHSNGFGAQGPTGRPAKAAQGAQVAHGAPGQSRPRGPGAQVAPVHGPPKGPKWRL